MARIFASTMALAATIVVLLVFGVASAVSAPKGCPHNYNLTEVGNNEDYRAVDGNGDGFVCVYFGKNPLPKQKDEVVDNKLPRTK
ncbi:MAG TPA: hypothetical protein VMK83_10870 [Gaiellaceae bacterium]|nr:hypothetical protein [Gaiellaceae bacterium]